MKLKQDEEDQKQKDIKKVKGQNLGLFTNRSKSNNNKTSRSVRGGKATHKGSDKKQDDVTDRV